MFPLRSNSSSTLRGASPRSRRLLAADAREDGDGKALASCQNRRRLAQCSSDEVFRRSERERRRKGRVRNAIIAVLAILGVAASGSALYAWQQLNTNEAFLNATLERATDIVSTAVKQAGLWRARARPH